jgi:hypothetical protein
MTLLLLSSFSFIISANAFENVEIDSSFFYTIASFSPVYLLFRAQGTLWNSEWMYLDTPFHYGFESANLSFQASIYFCIVLVASIVKKNA